jgi:hypothetical protein
MNVNYFVKCRICGKITRIRIPVGHLDEYPIRIYCGKCESILRGRFIIQQEEVKYHAEFDNCDEVFSENADFFSEISGELLCNKVEDCSDKDNIYHYATRLPFMVSASAMGFPSMQEYISKLQDINIQLKEWENNRTVFDLYKGRKYEYIPSLLSLKLPKDEFGLSNNIEILRGVHYFFLKSVTNIFETKDYVRMLKLINKEFADIDNLKLKELISYLDGTDSLDLLYDKMIDILCNFMKVFRNILPALCAKRYEEDTINYNTQGITTCTFDDIKMFYIDTYEALLSMIIIPISLDNIKYRNEFTSFNDGNTTLENLNKMSKGNRLHILNKSETFSNLININMNNKLRNAIGHNNYIYNGLTQIIEFSPDPKHLDKKEKKYLLEVAVECIDLMQTTVIMSDYIIHLIRKKNMFSGIKTSVESIFYQHVSVNDKCPCGSGEKYKRCCKDIIQKKLNKKSYRP